MISMTRIIGYGMAVLGVVGAALVNVTGGDTMPCWAQAVFGALLLNATKNEKKP